MFVLDVSFTVEHICDSTSVQLSNTLPFAVPTICALVLGIVFWDTGGKTFLEAAAAVSLTGRGMDSLYVQ